jgi:hypothetical protein
MKLTKKLGAEVLRKLVIINDAFSTLKIALELNRILQVTMVKVS